MYKLVKNPISGEVAVFNTETNTSFYENPANTDYQAYLKWLEEGNQPLPADQGATE